MKNYIAYLDVLGTKNSSENENFNEYIKLITCFQNALVLSADLLEKDARIYFFSDCAYIESTKINSIIETLSSIRLSLFDDDIFVRGALVEGELGALNSEDIKKCISRYSKNEEFMRKMKTPINFFTKSKSASKIKGTLFFSKDVAKAYYHESTLKGAAIFVDYDLKKEFKDTTSVAIVKSGYISDVQKNTYKSFYDIKYDSELITSSFIEKVLKHYTLSNTANVKYGRYYLTLLISCVNSVDYSNTKYDSKIKKFTNAPEIFSQIIHLKQNHRLLYNNAKGLEYLYFSLIDKFYFDVEDIPIRRIFLKEIFTNYRFLSKYQNKISQLPKELLSNKNKNLLLQDLVEITYFASKK